MTIDKIAFVVDLIPAIVLCWWLKGYRVSLVATKPVPSVPLSLFFEAHQKLIGSRDQKCLWIASPFSCHISLETATPYSKRTCLLPGHTVELVITSGMILYTQVETYSSA